MIPRIHFKGEEYLLVGEFADAEAPEGAIATEAQYRNGICSYAHLLSDGRVMRFREQIGSREDIEWLGDSEMTMGLGESIEAIRNVLSHPSWPFNREPLTQETP